MQMITIEDAKKLNPRLNPKLFFPSPEDVLNAIRENDIVKEWLEFIAEKHIARSAEVLLLVPCTPKKPYDPPRDEFHRKLIELEKNYDVYLVSVSEPLSLEPREYWNFVWKRDGEEINLVYDAPFFPWIEKYGYRWSEEIAREVWEILSRVAGRWYERNRKKFERVICLAFPETGYRKIVSRIDVDVFVPEKRPEELGIEVKEDYFQNTDSDYIKVWDELMRVLTV